MDYLRTRNDISELEESTRQITQQETEKRERNKSCCVTHPSAWLIPGFRSGGLKKKTTEML